MALSDYGIIIKNKNYVFAGNYDFSIRLDNSNIVLEVYKDILYIKDNSNKNTEQICLGYLFTEKDDCEEFCCKQYNKSTLYKINKINAKIKDVIIDNNRIRVVARNKFGLNTKFTILINDYIIELGYGLPNSKEEYLYLSRPKRKVIYYDNYKKKIRSSRLSKKKIRPYGFTSKDVKYYKHYF